MFGIPLPEPFLQRTTATVRETMAEISVYTQCDIIILSCIVRIIIFSIRFNTSLAFIKLYKYYSHSYEDTDMVNLFKTMKSMPPSFVSHSHCTIADDNRN